jgi:hypothetical protein
MANEAYVAANKFATLPLSATDVAVRWDSLYSFVMGLSIFFFILVVGG